MRMRGTIVTAALVVLGAGVAEAGPVGSTVGGIRRNVGSGNGGSRSGVNAYYFSNPYYRYREYQYDQYGQRVVHRACVSSCPRPAAPNEPKATADVYAGVSKVKGSDGAFAVEALASAQRFGFAMRVIGYHEGSEARTGGPSSRLTQPMMETPAGAAASSLYAWEIAGRVKVFGDRETSLWAEVGVAGLSVGGGPSLSGFEGGVSLEQRLGRGPSVFASARGYTFEDDITALGLQAGLRWSVLRGGVRLLDFNVGPPLVGPELGVALTF